MELYIQALLLILSKEFMNINIEKENPQLVDIYESICG